MGVQCSTNVSYLWKTKLLCVFCTSDKFEERKKHIRAKLHIAGCYMSDNMLPSDFYMSFPTSMYNNERAIVERSSLLLHKTYLKSLETWNTSEAVEPHCLWKTVIFKYVYKGGSIRLIRLARCWVQCKESRWGVASNFTASASLSLIMNTQCRLWKSSSGGKPSVLLWSRSHRSKFLF